jgi:SAM-dependent methyltransferase
VHGVTQDRYVSEVLDRFTIGRIIGLGRRLAGLSCLEVGAGSGSIAVWLAGEVGAGGAGGRVVAIDKHPMPLPLPNVHRLAVVAHDITTRPAPRQPYDLVHARLALMHVAHPVEVLRLLAHALVPGGMLLVEDWDMTWREGQVLRAPSQADKRLWKDFHDCLVGVFVADGADPGWASTVLETMVDAGLRDVGAEVHTRSWRGGEPGCMFVAGVTVQLRDKLIKQGCTPQDLHRVRQLMADPLMTIRLPPLVSTVGWRR